MSDERRGGLPVDLAGRRPQATDAVADLQDVEVPCSAGNSTALGLPRIPHHAEGKGNMKTSRWLTSILTAFAIFAAAPFAFAQNAAVVMACASVPHATTPNAQTFVVNQYDSSPGAPDIVLLTTSCATALGQLFDAGLVLVSVRDTASGPAFTLVRPRGNFAGTP
jgi:hypothetical protein